MFKFIITSTIMFIAELLAFILVPIVVPLADRNGRLPYGFRWLETPDALGYGAGSYEPAVKAIQDKYGLELGLMYWLMRNRAYGLSAKLRANINYGNMYLESSGVDVPPKWGFWKWTGNIADGNNEWFDYQYGVSLGLFFIYFRLGWKLKPLFKGEIPVDPKKSAIGLFTGITIRTDDWNDFPEDQRPK